MNIQELKDIDISANLSDVQIFSKRREVFVLFNRSLEDVGDIDDLREENLHGLIVFRKIKTMRFGGPNDEGLVNHLVNRFYCI